MHSTEYGWSHHNGLNIYCGQWDDVQSVIGKNDDLIWQDDNQNDAMLMFNSYIQMDQEHRNTKQQWLSSMSGAGDVQKITAYIRHLYRLTGNNSMHGVCVHGVDCGRG